MNEDYIAPPAEEAGEGTAELSATPEPAANPVEPAKPSTEPVDAAKEKHRREMRDLHAGFHPVWGAMMKTGSQNSRFAHQLERYACLYTSHARNLLAYSPSKNYRGMSDTMPHDVEEEFH